MSYLQVLNAGLINPSNQVAKYNYTTLDITSPNSVGYQYSTSDSTGWTPTDDDAWHEFYVSSEDYPAGVYMLSVQINYSNTDPVDYVEQIIFGLNDSTSDTPQIGKTCSSNYNQGFLNMTVSFISDGSLDQNIHLCYNIGDIPNITIDLVSYNLTRIG
jgi:hypothetical protein